MKLFDYKKYRISKNFLIAASAYRRSVREHHGFTHFDFSIDALKSQYDRETFGGSKPDPKINGYTYGKSIFDITMAAVEEDLATGLFCKYELLQGAGALKRKLISNMMAGDCFGWRKEWKNVNPAKER